MILTVMHFLPILLALFLTSCAHWTGNGVDSSAVTDQPNLARYAFSRLMKESIRERIGGHKARNKSSNVNYSNIWARMRDGFGVLLTSGVEIEQQIQNYSKCPDYFSRMLERSRPYLFHVIEELEKRRMPMEIALIPFVESAYNPQALSSAKAAGIWQFIPSTGREYKLRQNFFSDQRRDVLASTDAALGYLDKLYIMFGDWKLALAAYNWGEGNLQRSIKKNLLQGRPVDYANLKLPKETRNYVPKIEALKRIIQQPDYFRVTLPEIPNHPYFVTVTTSRDIDIKVAAQLANLSLKDFSALNPAFNRPVILGVTSPQILLPYENASLFEQGIKTYKQALSSWTAYRIVRSEYPATLAHRMGMSLKTLMTVNKIPIGARLKSGSTVLIPKWRNSNHPDIDAFVAENAVLSLETDKANLRRRVIHTESRFTVLAFAQQHKVRVGQLREWNPKLPKRIIPAGTAVTLHLPYRRTTPAQMRKRRLKNVQVVRHSLGNNFSKKVTGSRRGQLEGGPALRLIRSTRNSVSKKQLAA